MFRCILAALAVVLSACGGVAAPVATSIATTPAAGATAMPLAGTLSIFAAASLTESFNALAAEFTTDNPALRITPNYAGSSGLVAQIIQGADADIFASADQANMQKLIDAKLSAGDPRIFASNRLQIVVQAGNPKRIAQLADLARPDVIVVLGASSVPVGAYAQQAFDKAGVKVTPRSLETDVKLVVTKVALGEADAGIVYATDVKAGGAKIQGVEVPPQFNVTATYPLAIVKGAKNESAARAFIDFVLSSRGREVLASFGFLLP
jgi:molybdate transport system substrate-binding protein